MEIDLVVRVRGQDDALDRDALSDALASAAASHLRSVTVAQLASGGGFAALEEAMRDKAATLIVAAASSCSRSASWTFARSRDSGCSARART